MWPVVLVTFVPGEQQATKYAQQSRFQADSGTMEEGVDCSYCLDDTHSSATVAAVFLHEGTCNNRRGPNTKAQAPPKA
jgi:hypothetical protein